MWYEQLVMIASYIEVLESSMYVLSLNINPVVNYNYSQLYQDTFWDEFLVAF